MNNNRNLHAIEALSISTDEVVPLGLVKRDEIFTTGPVA